MDSDEEVWYPFVLFLCNLPVKADPEGVLKCTFTNKDMAELFGDFAQYLKQTVKVVYGRNGVLRWKGGAYAYAVFQEYYHAQAISKAFKDEERGQDDFYRHCRGHQRRRANVENKIYGWLADESDFELLERTRAFKNRRKMRVSEIVAQKIARRDQLAQQCAQGRQALEKLDAEVEESNRQLAKTMMELEGAETEDMAAREEQRRRNEVRSELENRKRELAQQLEEVQSKVGEMGRQVNEHEYGFNEQQRLILSICSVQLKYEKCMREKEQFERQCEKADMEYKEFAESLRIETANVDAVKERCKRLFEEREQYRNDRRALQVMDQLKSTWNFKENECRLCFLEFTPVMTIEEQQSKGISTEEFERMNLMPSTEDRCWRNVALPCQHAVMCGHCSNEWKKARTNQYDQGKLVPVPCIWCGQPVERYVFVRFSTPGNG